MTKEHSNYIKFIAILTMTIDHVGYILFPDIHVLRIIGRISFPLFAYQIGIGYQNTKSFKQYFLRIGLYGIVIQLIFGFASFIFHLNEDVLYLNIFFTLALGLLTIYLYDTKKYFYLLMTLLSPLLLLELFNVTVDYTWYGLGLILIFYIGKWNLKDTIPVVIALTWIYCIVDKEDFTQMYSLLAFLFLWKPLHLKRNIPNYLFYLYYPIHLMILQGIRFLF